MSALIIGLGNIGIGGSALLEGETCDAMCIEFPASRTLLQAISTQPDLTWVT